MTLENCNSGDGVEVSTGTVPPLPCALLSLLNKMLRLSTRQTIDLVSFLESFVLCTTFGGTYPPTPFLWFFYDSLSPSLLSGVCSR